MDLISREAAIRIAEQAQIHGYLWQFEQLVKLPSAQPEIIQCKDCKHSYLYVGWDESPPRLYCDILRHHYYDDTDLCVDAEGFCYLGKRRQDDVG